MGIVYSYDATNRLYKTAVFDGTNTTVVSYKEFDGRGNVLKDVNGEGYNTDNPSTSIGDVRVYDVYNNVTSLTTAATVKYNTQIGQNNKTKQYTYDAAGNVISEIDAAGNQTTYTYYLNGNLKSKTYADTVAENYDYDWTGKFTTTKTDRAGRVTTIGLNLFGKPYTILNPDGTTEAYEYNALGKLVSSVDRLGQTKEYS